MHQGQMELVMISVMILRSKSRSFYSLQENHYGKRLFRIKGIITTLSLSNQCHTMGRGCKLGHIPQWCAWHPAFPAKDNLNETNRAILWMPSRPLPLCGGGNTRPQQYTRDGTFNYACAFTKERMESFATRSWNTILDLALVRTLLQAWIVELLWPCVLLNFSKHCYGNEKDLGKGQIGHPLPPQTD